MLLLVVINILVVTRAFTCVECQRASRIVNQLGLVNKLKLKISAHKADTEKQKNKIDVELEGSSCSKITTTVSICVCVQCSLSTSAVSFQTLSPVVCV